MIRLAILGNSHAACLINALRDTPGVLGADITPTVFAATAQKMGDFAVKGTTLVPKTEVLQAQVARSSGGDGTIDTGAFDAFFLIGMGYRIDPVAAHYSEAVLASMRTHQDKVATLWHLVRQLRGVTDKPIFCGHCPLLAKALPDGPLVPYLSQLDQVRHLTQALAVTLVPQPEATREDDLKTRRSFTQGSQRLVAKNPHGDKDLSHMNAEYGTLYLEALRGLVAATAQQ